MRNIDQYEAYYKLDEAIDAACRDGDHDEELPSMRTLFEGMHEAGLVFAVGKQADTIARMDRDDAEGYPQRKDEQ